MEPKHCWIKKKDTCIDSEGSCQDSYMNFDYWKIMFGMPKSEVLKEHQICLDSEIKSQIQEAYERAHDIRKFEIELYWRRALYFWGFESILLIGFGYLFTLESEIYFKYPALIVLSFFGLILSYIWRLSLLGSKSWQENWEKHIDILEPCISGNLYKTVLSSYKGKETFYSVSKLNLSVAGLSIIFWSICLVVSIGLMVHGDANRSNELFMLLMVPILSLLTGCWLSDFNWKTDFSDHETFEKEKMIMRNRNDVYKRF